MTDRRIEIANISRVNEIIQDDPKAEIIKAYDESGLFVINYYESKGARMRREAQEAQIRQYHEWKAKEQQQPQPTQSNSEVRRGPGRPPKTQQPQPSIQQTPAVPTPAAVVTEKKKSRFNLRREKSPEVAQLQNRCVVCGSPNASIIRFKVPGAPTDGETRFCKTHSNIIDLTNIPLFQVG